MQNNYISTKGLSQLCYRIITVVLLEYHSCPTEISQLSYLNITVVLHDYHNCPMRLSQLSCRITSVEFRCSIAFDETEQYA